MCCSTSIVATDMRKLVRDDGFQFGVAESFRQIFRIKEADKNYYPRFLKMLPVSEPPLLLIKSIL
jgi:hypothetical protein